MKENTEQISITKSFAVSKNDLYNAWTDEAHLKQWWKPMNKQLLRAENDIAEGGKVVYVFENDLRVEGQYKEVQVGEKLVYSWNWSLPNDSHYNGEYLLTVSFKGNDEQSELEVMQQDFKQEHAVKPHQEGWEEALENLKQYLENKKNK